VPKILKFKGLAPKIHRDSFIAHGAVIAGDVTIAEHSGIWFNCVVRGDVNPVTIGSGTNIQDGTIVHTSRFDGPTFIGNNITIGHLALVHAEPQVMNHITIIVPYDTIRYFGALSFPSFAFTVE